MQAGPCADENSSWETDQGNINSDVRVTVRGAVNHCSTSNRSLASFGGTATEAFVGYFISRFVRGLQEQISCHFGRHLTRLHDGAANPWLDAQIP
jgi:hypothetical protein